MQDYSRAVDAVGADVTDEGEACLSLDEEGEVISTELGHRYILSVSHEAILPEIPIENVVAMAGEALV